MTDNSVAAPVSYGEPNSLFYPYSGSRSALTDANGNYSFTNLTPGNYTVAEVMKPGWQQTSPGAVTNGSFETGNLTGWNTQGNTSIKTTHSGINPTQRTYQALITNGGLTADSALSMLAPSRMQVRSVIILMWHQVKM